MKPWIPLVLALAAGCAPPSVRKGYDWGGYDEHLHALMRNPSGLEAYGASLRRIIDRNPDGTWVPPGIYAEYGYVLFLAGRKPEAADYFAREKTRWPESAKIMDRMIQSCAPPAEPGPGKEPS